MKCYLLHCALQREEYIQGNLKIRSLALDSYSAGDGNLSGLEWPSTELVIRG